MNLDLPKLAEETANKLTFYWITEKEAARPIILAALTKVQEDGNNRAESYCNKTRDQGDVIERLRHQLQACIQASKDMHATQAEKADKLKLGLDNSEK